ncbi:hypothetical protein HMPREF0058_0334 [Actinomyces urogenitalis DSM 15434]|uniref:ATP synthase F0, A subunit n=1 Tax=Actinomyces urogenitalis DSM 15434 TaxID=525246 RepID=C0W390_9ACTO|nr:hypothetical protein HMPREF0058_0334 [Actinomyces urogenitalis DSM 15434]
MADTESVTNDGEPRRRRSGLAAVMVRTQRLLHRGIARAEARRAADRAQVMGLDSFPARRGAHEAGTSEETGGQTAPVGVLSSLPGWLVRGGIGSWLGLGIFLVVALVFLGISRIVPVFVGVFIALVVTAILHPLVTFFARVMPRYPATFLALATTAAFLAALVYYVVSSVTDQWSSLAAQFSTGVNTILDFVEHGPLPIHFSQQEVVQTMQGLVNQGQRYVESNATSLAGEVLSNAGTVVNVFVVLALAVFTSIFLLASGGRMWRWFLNELPAHLRSRVHRAAGAGWYTFAGYARGTVILALTDAVMAGVFLQVVGVPLAAPLAVLVFIGAFIPMIGAPLAMIVAMVVALASKGFVAMVVVGLGVAGIGQIEGHILQPLIMGRQVSLHPVVVGIAVAVGTFSAGLLGAVVAVPLVSVAWSVYSELHVKDAPLEGSLPSYSPGREG